MSLEDELSNAITMFRDKLDSRPMAKSENSAQAGIQERGASFSSQLPIAATNEPRSGNANNDTQQNPPVQPKPSACFGFGTGNVTLAISGVISCPPGDTADPNGVFSLPYFTSGTGFCQWLLISGGFQYSFVLASDGTVSAAIQDTIAGNFYFQCDPVAYGTTMNDTIDLPCIPGDPATRGYGGSATASF